MKDTLRLHVTGRDGRVRESDARIDVSLLAMLRDAVGSLPEPGIEESDMLDTLVHQTSSSRLACQVALAAGIDSLRVKVAPEE
jgi:hypothetical protein